ncbi:MAG: tetratricopeptide repeat protein [Bacteroidales bacterium]|jgi:protein O-GlcNAc transferase|nr:tetratricopeptide repeat protein [Bacteroidales bacterium]
MKHCLKYIAFLLVLSGFIACNPDKKDVQVTDETIDITSIESLSEQIRENPKSPELFIHRAELYAEKGNVDEAINDLNISLKLDSLNANVYYKLIDYRMLKGQSGKAKTTAETCLKRFPGDKEALLRLAQIYYYVEEYMDALEYIRQIKSYNQQDADTYFIEALIFREMNVPAKAIESLQTVLEYDSEYIAAYNLLGQLYMNAGDIIALEYYKAGLMKAPENIELLYNLGFYYQENNQPQLALEQYNKLLDVTDSNHYGALYNSAYINLVQLEKYDEAINLFTDAIKIDSTAHKAFYNRGYAYELLGKYADAKSDYFKALEIVPNYPLAVQGLNALDNK